MAEFLPSEFIVKHGAATYNEEKSKWVIDVEPKEEIVRCRDCKYGCEVEWPKTWNIPADYLDCTGELVETWDYWNDQPNSNPVKPDGFCAWGERKNNVMSD